MADETQTGAGAEAEATTAPQAQPKLYPEEHVRELREEAKHNRLKARELENELKTLKEQLAQVAPKGDVNELKALLESERKERATAAEQAAKAKHEALQLRVASELGLPAALASKLTGETEEELRADAELFKPYVTPSNGQQRPTGNTTAVPGGSPQNETDAQKRARIYHNREGGLFGS